MSGRSTMLLLWLAVLSGCLSPAAAVPAMPPGLAASSSLGSSSLASSHTPAAAVAPAAPGASPMRRDRGFDSAAEATARQTEHQLRSAFAAAVDAAAASSSAAGSSAATSSAATSSAANSVAAARALADWLTAQERLAEALQVLQAAVLRGGEVAAQQLAADLAACQRNLGQRDAAVATLAAARARVGAASLPPALLLELAELHWVQGDAAAAQQVLAEVQQHHELALLGTALGEDAASLQAELAAADGTQPLRLCDLLGDLRGAADAAQRLAALQLCASLAAQQPELQPLLAQAVVIACGDDDSQLRVRALELLQPASDQAAAIAAAALTDPAPPVRAVAACRSVAWLGESALPLLLAGIGDEDDAEALAARWAALRSLRPALPELPAGIAADPLQRRDFLAAWEAACRD